MFFRRYNFIRYILGSVFLVGCLLLLAVFSDSRRSLIKEMSSMSNYYRTPQSSTDPFQSSHGSKGGLKSLIFIPSNPQPGLKPEGSSDSMRGWYEEEFPDIFSTPRVSAIMETFRKKIALANRKLINPHIFDYIHNVPDACTGRDVELVVGIPSRIESFDTRQAIRESWGQYRNNPANKAIVLFFLGTKNDKALQDKVNEEALKYKDIVQENFVDSYRNLSLKTVAFMKWISTFCTDSTFVLKADDDMYINIPRLLARLRDQLNRGPMFILGAVHHNTEPLRDQKNMWYVGRDEYPNKSFPNYVSGSAYAMSSTAAMRLYVESLYMKSLFLEDVYLTGLVADRAAVPRVGESDFTWAKLDPYGCIFKYKISGHKNSPDDIRKIHHELNDPNIKCY